MGEMWNSARASDTHGGVAGEREQFFKRPPELLGAHRDVPAASQRVFCHPKRGTPYSAEIWRPHFDAALKAAGIEGRVRPFHDLRHTGITLDAASGASEIAVMTKAGHSSFATTRTYLHLAGTVFRDEAERMERMALGGSSTEPSTDLSEPQNTEQDAAGLTARE